MKLHMNYIGYSKVIITVNAFFIDTCRFVFFFIFLKCIQVTLRQKFFKPFTRKYFRLFSKHEKPQYLASGPKERVHTLMAAIIVKAMAWLLRFLLERVVNTLPDPAVITQFTARYTRQVSLQNSTVNNAKSCFRGSRRCESARQARA